MITCVNVEAATELYKMRMRRPLCCLPPGAAMTVSLARQVEKRNRSFEASWHTAKTPHTPNIAKKAKRPAQ